MVTLSSRAGTVSFSFNARLAPRALLSRRQRGRSSEVERQLPKLNVRGSIPLARSIFLTPAIRRRFQRLASQIRKSKRPSSLQEWLKDRSRGAGMCGGRTPAFRFQAARATMIGARRHCLRRGSSGACSPCSWWAASTSMLASKISPQLLQIFRNSLCAMDMAFLCWRRFWRQRRNATSVLVAKRYATAHTHPYKLHNSGGD